MEIRPETPVADLARRYPATIAVFQRHQIDFCCGGQRPLAQVCRERNLAPAALIAELEATQHGAAEPGTDWSRASLAELMDHIVQRFHDPLRLDLPRLGGLAKRVAEHHGPTRPFLVELAAVFQRLGEEMLQHMQKEEVVLFPVIERLECGRDLGLPSLEGPISVMEEEHLQVAEMLRRMRSLTGGYALPDDACNSFRGLYDGLAKLESDTHTHIHLENNVLFPRAQELVEHALR